MTAGKQSPLPFCGYIKFLSQCALALQEFSGNALANVGAGFSQTIEQGTRAGPFGCLQRQRIITCGGVETVQAHQHIDVCLEELVHGSEVRGAQLLAGDSCAQMLNDVESFFEARPGFSEIATIALDERNATQRRCCCASVFYGSAEL